MSYTEKTEIHKKTLETLSNADYFQCKGLVFPKVIYRVYNVQGSTPQNIVNEKRDSCSFVSPTGFFFTTNETSLTFATCISPKLLKEYRSCIRNIYVGFVSFPKNREKNCLKKKTDSRSSNLREMFFYMPETIYNEPKKVVT